jgi:hypothetical protein
MVREREAIMLSGHRPSRTIAVAVALAVGLAAGAALAIIALGANIRGTVIGPGEVDGKAAGLALSLSDGNLVAGRPGSQRTSVQSDAESARVAHVLRQRLPEGRLMLAIKGRRDEFPPDPAQGVLAARMLLKDIRMVVDHLFDTGTLPSVLPPGVEVKLRGPQPDATAARTLRVLVERHLILGFAALGADYAHAVTGNSAASSEVHFGPPLVNGLAVLVSETP